MTMTMTMMREGEECHFRENATTLHALGLGNAISLPRDFIRAHSALPSRFALFASGALEKAQWGKTKKKNEEKNNTRKPERDGQPESRHRDALSGQVDAALASLRSFIYLFMYFFIFFIYVF